jgi:hypothetical protein
LKLYPYGWRTGSKGTTDLFLKRVDCGAKGSKFQKILKMRMRRGRYENISKSFKYTIFSY